MLKRMILKIFVRDLDLGKDKMGLENYSVYISLNGGIKEILLLSDKTIGGTLHLMKSEDVIKLTVKCMKSQ